MKIRIFLATIFLFFIGFFNSIFLMVTIDCFLDSELGAAIIGTFVFVIFSLIFVFIFSKSGLKDKLIENDSYSAFKRVIPIVFSILTLAFICLSRAGSNNEPKDISVDRTIPNTSVSKETEDVTKDFTESSTTTNASSVTTVVTTATTIDERIKTTTTSSTKITTTTYATIVDKTSTTSNKTTTNTSKQSTTSKVTTTSKQPQSTTTKIQVTLYRYILNTNTMKAHTPNCSSVPTINPENKSEYTGTSDDLKRMGYSSCGKCKPW